MEQKIVLEVKGDSALYLFKHDGQTEFVVAYSDGNVYVGQEVKSWSNGHYFYTLEESLEYLKLR